MHDSRNMHTRMTGAADVEVENHGYNDGGIFTIIVTVDDQCADDMINGNRFHLTEDSVG